MNQKPASRGDEDRAFRLQRAGGLDKAGGKHGVGRAVLHDLRSVRTIDHADPRWQIIAGRVAGIALDPSGRPASIEASAAVVEITQYGSTRSINASAAAAVAMHSWVMQRSPLRPGAAPRTPNLAKGPAS